MISDSIRRSESVLLFALAAIGRGLNVIQLMLNRRERVQESEDGFQIVVRHLAKELPGH